MTLTENTTIGELVAQDYRTAAVFSSFGIDFCCKGNRLISVACEEKKLDPKALLESLEGVMSRNETQIMDYNGFSIGLLAEYIEKKHHAYVETKIPEIKSYLNKIKGVHGKTHPELIEINQLFTASTGELTAHMKREELILFPYIKKLELAVQQNIPLQSKLFATVENPIAQMMEEHETEGDRFRKIEKLSNQYTPPSDACGTYKVSFALLKEFQDDLHLHIHLENNILFPKAIEMATSLTEEKC